MAPRPIRRGFKFDKNSRKGCARFEKKTSWLHSVLGDTLRAFANCRKEDWDVWLPYAVFAINNTVSTLGGDLTQFFIDRGQQPRLPLSLRTCGRLGSLLLPTGPG